MKKVIAIVGSVLIVCLTGLIVVGVIVYTGVLNKNILNKETVYVYSTDDGYVYTESEWDWKPAEFKGAISYVDTVTDFKQKVTLCLDDNTYYDVIIPNIDYIYDYGKTVWAIDGSYMIRVIANATMDNLSSLAGIDNSIPLTQTTICSPDNQKGSRTIATLVNSYAIIANVYYSDNVFSILRDSLSSGKSPYAPSEPDYSDEYVELDKLSYFGKYIGQVTFQEVSLEQKKYMFQDGTLWCSSVFDNFINTKETYLKKLCTITNAKIDESYQAGGIYYAKAGNYYLGVVAYNTNTTIVFLGDGEESKCNIIFMINYLK